MAPPFPHLPQWLGYEAPCRFEGECFDLVVNGEIPKSINGTFYRVGPDPQVVPKFENENNFHGDGTVGAFRIKDGHVDFKNRWVRTERFVRERSARKAVFGRYRNRYTNDPEILWANGTTSNTNIVWFNGHLLALKEDALPSEMDPDTLETIGPYDFDGQYKAPTFTAHPKPDPETGELVTWGYMAKGDGTTDVAYYLFDKNGKKLEECWFHAPYAGLMHDVAITPNYVAFQMYPLACDLERIKAGGLYFEYDEKLPMYLLLLPKRNPKPTDIKWFEWEPDHFEGHVSNAFEKNGKVYVDFPVFKGNVFNFFPDKDGKAPPRHTLTCRFPRFELDPHTTNLKIPEPEWLSQVTGEFSRIDERFQGREYTWTYICGIEMTKPFDAVKSKRPFPGFNTIARINHKTKTTEHYWPGDCAGVQEPVFIPRTPDAPEGDGYVIFLCNRFDTNLTDLIILDTAKWQEPQAIINLPIRLRSGVHGNWVDGDVLGTTKELIDMAGVPITPYGALPKPNSHAVSIVGAEAAGVAAGRGGAPAINGAVNGHDA